MILGIDPGTTSMGYAILRPDKPSPVLLKAGLIKTVSLAADEKLLEIHLELRDLIKKWKPRAVALERLFFGKNQKTALAVAEARGVVLLTTSLAGIKVFEYTPLEVKKNVTGYGRADKLQLKKMINLVLPETRLLKAGDDVFDAIAVGITCCLKERSNST